MGRKRCLILLLCLVHLFCLRAGAEAAVSYPIAPELPDCPELWKLDTGHDGPVILIIAGIHGDEAAGIQAALTLDRLPLTCGTLYWIPAANPYGAEHNRRKTRDDRDLNRNFPGDPSGNPTKQLAAQITQQILDIGPDLVLDLHEATAWEDGWDNLGSSVIFADLDPVADLIFELMDLENAPNFFSSPPQGSLNACLTQDFGIPVLTLESPRESPLDSRIQFHQTLIEFILTYYGML